MQSPPHPEPGSIIDVRRIRGRRLVTAAGAIAVMTGAQGNARQSRQRTLRAQTRVIRACDPVRRRPPGRLTTRGDAA